MCGPLPFGESSEAGLAKAAVSQRISRLEARLGVQLLRRSTRKLSLTDDGVRLFEHAANLVDVTRAADESLAAGEAVRGTVRLEAPASLHRGLLAGALNGFLSRHPAVALRVTLDDRLTDLVEGDFDVVVRLIAPGRRTSVARKLGTDRAIVVGAPRYFEAVPPPVTPYDLVHHACLRNSSIPERVDWRMSEGGKNYSVPVASRFESNDFGLLHEAALAGMGLLVTPRMTVADDLRAGRLREVLQAFTAEPLGLFAFFAERARPTSATRALVDHLALHLARALRSDAP